VLLEITAGVDAARTPPQAFWTFRSIDPATGLPPIDANLGFLPPNDETDRGQGRVEYSVRPAASAAHGAIVPNRAIIIFDVNEPIATNTVSNTLDATLPTSSLAALPPVSAGGTLLLNYTAEDAPNGSGLKAVRTYASVDGSQYLLSGDFTDLVASYSSSPGHVYRFYSIAIDNAGNLELAPGAPDAVTTVPGVAFADGSDTGSNSEDRLTNLRTPSFVVVSAPMSTTQIDIAGPTHVVGSAQIGANGRGVFTVPAGTPLAQGSYTLTMTGGGVATEFEFIVDTTPPALQGWSMVATHGALGEIELPIAADGSSSEPRGSGISKVHLRFSPMEQGLAAITPQNVLINGVDINNQPVNLSGITRAVSLLDDGLTYEIILTPALPDKARYCFRVQGISDAAGNALSIPNSRRSVAALKGDAFEDRRVNNTDVGGVLSLVGTNPINPANTNHVRSDVNTDGRVDVADRAIVLAARNTDLRAVNEPCPVGRDDDGVNGVVRSVGPLVADGIPDGVTIAPAPMPNGPPILAGPTTPTSPTSPTPAANAPQDIAPAMDDSLTTGSTVINGQTYRLSDNVLAVFDPTGTHSIRASLEPLGFAKQTIRPWIVRDWWLADLPENARSSPAAIRALAARVCGRGLFASPVLLDENSAFMVVAPSIEVRFNDLQDLNSPAFTGSFTGAVRSVDAGAIIVSRRGGDDGRAWLIASSACDGYSVLDQARAMAAKSPIAAAKPTDPRHDPRAGAFGHVGAFGHLWGDLNTDGELDQTDLALLVDALSTGDENADLNRDGTVDIDDVAWLAQHVK